MLDDKPTLETYEALMLDFLSNYHKIRKESMSTRLMFSLLDEEADTLRKYLFAFMANKTEDDN